MSVDVTKDRHTSIGGSEAGIILGVNKYKSVHDLWLEKTQRKENTFKGNAATKRGQEMEPLLFKMFSIKNKEKYKITYDDRKWESQDNSFMSAHVDGLIEEIETGCKGILEIKTAVINNKDVLSDWTDKVPDTYYCQILHYMAVTGAEFAVLYAWIDISWADKQELRTYYFKRSECQEDIDYLIEKEKEFWNMAVNDIEPELIKKNIEI